MKTWQPLKASALIALSVLTMGLTAHAQDEVAQDSAPSNEAGLSTRVKTRANRRSGITLIPTLGLSTSNVYISGSDPIEGLNVTPNQRLGFGGGILAEFGRGMVSFQTGLLYLQEGAKISATYFSSTETQTNEGTARVDYVGIPLEAKLNMRGGGGARYGIKAGVIPVYAAGVSSEFESTRQNTAAGTVSSSKESSSERGSMRDVNILGSIGIGTEIPVARGMDTRLDVVFHHGLLPMARENEGSLKMYSQSLMITLGMGFDI